MTSHMHYTLSGYAESENEYDHLVLNSSTDTIYFTEDEGTVYLQN